MSATTSLDVQAIRQLLQFMADRIFAAQGELTQADCHLGDGDHGLGMTRGFEAVKTKLQEQSGDTIGKLFATAGLTLLSTMGGASGALFGTFFRAGGKALGDCARFEAAAYATFLEAALASLKARGGAKVGDKTMVDALEPAANRAREFAGRTLTESAEAVAAAARGGATATIVMAAQVGRAKALGAASVGYPDPGALSVAILLEVVRAFELSGHVSIR
jgi:dihydroxyacetone kinase-like protein